MAKSIINDLLSSARKSLSHKPLNRNYILIVLRMTTIANGVTKSVVRMPNEFYLISSIAESS